jgi:hypothetical protein
VRAPEEEVEMSSKRGLLAVLGITILALGVLLAPAAALAQSQSSGRPVGVGGKIAWNSSRVRGEAESDIGLPINFGNGSGYSLGGVLSFAAGPHVTIQPEFIYSEKEVTADVRFGDIIGNGEIHSDWFEIPLLAKFHGERTRGARPFAMAGATVSFLVNAEQTLTVGDETEVEDIKDELTGTDVGLTLGAGVDLLRDWGIFTIDVRYTFGLRRLADGDDVNLDTLALSGGFIF